MNYKDSINFFQKNSLSNFSFTTEIEMKRLLNSKSKYVYLIIWSSTKNIYSWGTMSGGSNRIRKSSILNKKLTGKYDRRVDYLMLKKILGFEKIFLFEFENPVKYESLLKTTLNQKHCYVGLDGNNREEISLNIYESFKLSNWFCQFDNHTIKLFDEFFNDIFLGKMKHPENPKRTFYYGDCLEPKFMVTINKKYLEPVIESVLDVKFYN